jgi:hypothetical protein
MELVILCALSGVVVAVAIDAIRKRPPRRPRGDDDPTITTTQKIIVDLSKRR